MTGMRGSWATRGRGSQPQGQDERGKLPELAPQTGLEFSAQLLDVSVQIIEALGYLREGLFQLGHADVQGVEGHHGPYYSGILL